MAKRAKPVSRSSQLPDEDIPVVGPREPCPCGSGRRYKACHGRVSHAATPFVGRPFDGLPSESDWVALREFVPAGTARLTLAGENSERVASVATLLPMVAAGLVRPDGEIMIGLQVPGGSGDPSRDYASVLESLLDAEPGTVLSSVGLPEPGARLQDLLDPEAPLDVRLYEGFDYWSDALEDTDGSIAASIERANAVVTPTARLTSVAGAYWCRNGDRLYLRWIRPESEDDLVDAFARLHVRSEDGLGEGTRYIGAFRAHGLLVSVWDLPDDATAESLEEPVAALDERIRVALADTTPLDAAERAARSGLRNRQRTLR